MLLNVTSIESAMRKLTDQLDISCRYRTLISQLPQANNQQDLETVDIQDAAGRFLAETVTASFDVPGFNRSTVDGYAVRAADTFGASEALPAMLRFEGDILMGHGAANKLTAGTCQGIATGGALPEQADAAVMIEDTEPAHSEDSMRYILKPVSPGQNIIFRGDDVKQGQPLLHAGLFLKPHHIGTLAAVGYSKIKVARKMRVALISTGDEIRSPGQPLGEGQIYDVNTPMLAALITRKNINVNFCGIVSDQLDVLKEALQRAWQAHDLIILTGGSSAGEKDHAAGAISELGHPGVLQHGLAVKPGKPTLIGQVDGVPIIGLPGHPVAAWFMADQIVMPLLELLSGRKPQTRKTVKAVLSRTLPANHGRQSFIAVKLDLSDAKDAEDNLSIEKQTKENQTTLNQIKENSNKEKQTKENLDKENSNKENSNKENSTEENADKENKALPLAVPIVSKSGLITTLRMTDGYMIIERDCEGLSAGSLIDVYLWEASSC